ncbi:MAG: DUF4062 domain-containing protein [Lachnospiraceae bacterium]|nr:DUF4062 domain-containing protein [Lachnospiraceae bacterium]
MASTEIKQHIPIFISSTYEDLIPYREEVQRNLIRLEQIIKGMEYFGSNPQDSLTVCLSQVRESKLFIGIIGMRYGSIDDESGLSFSQMEYNEAIKNKIPTLIYIMSEEHLIPVKFVDIGEKAEKLAEFKKNLKKQHTVSFFTSPDDLGKKIVKDVMDALSRLEKISIDTTKMLPDNSEDYEDTIRKFLLRPVKYQGIEIELEMKVVSGLSGNSLKNDIVKTLGLELGDTLSVDVYILGKDGEILIDHQISIYADKENADWLENVLPGNIIRAQIRTAFCAIKELSKWDEGRILRNTSYLGLIIKKGLEIRAS